MVRAARRFALALALAVIVATLPAASAGAAPPTVEVMGVGFDALRRPVDTTSASLTRTKSRGPPTRSTWSAR